MIGLRAGSGALSDADRRVPIETPPGGGVKYGRDEGEWATLTDETKDFLIDCAQRRDLTTYSDLNRELVERTGLAAFDFSQPTDRAAMGHLLFRVVDSAFQETGLMLSALVTYIDANDAGPGFYSLAADLGLLPRKASKAQQEVFWTGQVSKIFDHYESESD